MTRLGGSVAFVTGAAGGIGRAICARLAREGAAVAVVDRDGERAEHVAAELRDDGTAVRALGVACDVTEPAQVAAALARVAERIGPVSLLVNNAARCGPDRTLETAPEAWAADVAVTLTAPYLCTRAVLPGMIARGGGAIVNVSSVNAAIALGNDAYSAAKAGLESLTRNVATRHGADGVRCNAVAPGTVRTPAWDARLAQDPAVLERLARRYPLGRVGEPEDIAAAVAFLASPDAAWITGAILPVDGGLHAGNAPLIAELIPRTADA